MVCSAMATFAVLLTYLGVVAAQTYTSCNPLQNSCPSNPGFTSKSLTTDFTKGPSPDWSVINASTINYNSAGVGFTINSKTDTPTLGTDFYLLFGYVEVTMKAAPGTGIVSAIVLESDDLDEIDWEALGSSPNTIQSNFFGKGNTTTHDRGQTHPVSASTTAFHTYGINWTSSAITWSIDGVIVRTLYSTDASTLYGRNFPQTPCRLRIGNWPAGASSNGWTVQWAGGATDFSQAPFTMYISSINVVNYNPASSYTYGDNSGSWQSIKIAGGATTPSGSGSKSGPVSAINSTSPASSTPTSAATFTSSTATRFNTSSTILTTSTTSLSSSTRSATTSTGASSTSANARSTNGAVRQATDISGDSPILYLVLTALSVFWL